MSYERKIGLMEPFFSETINSPRYVTHVVTPIFVHTPVRLRGNLLLFSLQQQSATAETTDSSMSDGACGDRVV